MQKSSKLPYSQSLQYAQVKTDLMKITCTFKQLSSSGKEKSHI